MAPGRKRRERQDTHINGGTDDAANMGDDTSSSSPTTQLDTRQNMEEIELPEYSQMSALPRDRSVVQRNNHSDVEALKTEHRNITACAILHCIDNCLPRKGAKPREVASTVAQQFLIYFWDRTSSSFQEVKPQDFEKVSNVMDSMVGSAQQCTLGVKSRTALVKHGKKILTEDYLKQIRYGARLPPSRSATQDTGIAASQDSQSNDGERPAGLEKLASSLLQRKEPRSYEPIQTELTGILDIATPALRRDRQASKRRQVVAVDVCATSSETHTGDYLKRQISHSSSGTKKRSRIVDEGKADRPDQTPLTAPHLLDSKLPYYVTSSPQTSMPFSDSTDYYLDDDHLATQMQNLYAVVVSLVYSQILSDQGLVLQQPAIFVIGQKCDAPLNRLYETLLGRRISGSTRERICSVMLASELTVALVGAFLYSVVFTHSKIETADHWLESMDVTAGSNRPMMERQLRSFGTNFDTVLRHTYRSSIHLQDFQDSKLAPIANELADKLSYLLYDHLAAHEQNESLSRISRPQAALRWSHHLAKLIMQALTLRCEMSSAREPYKFQWHPAETKYNAQFMECTHALGGEVLAPVFPGIAVTKDGSLESVCKARVRLI